MRQLLNYLRVWFHLLGREERNGHRLWVNHRLLKPIREGGEWTTSYHCQCGYLDRPTV